MMAKIMLTDMTAIPPYNNNSLSDIIYGTPAILTFSPLIFEFQILTISITDFLSEFVLYLFFSP